MIYRFNPNASIPNNPFYYPPEQGLQSISGPLIVGTGLSIDYVTGIISATGGGGGGGGGPVLVTSPITNTGTLTNPIIGIQTATTDQFGAVKIGSNINVQGGVISVGFGSTFAPGIVQLNDTVASTSILQALTANQGRLLQQQINALVVASNLTLAGTFSALTGKMVTVSNAGSFAGFTVGSNLPLPTASISDFFVIVSQPGTYTPPGSTTPVNALHGDWFLCENSVWKYVNVGNQLPVATETSAGVIELANQAEVSQGIDSIKAVTPATLSAVYLKKSILTDKGNLISASSAGLPQVLPVGVDGTILVSDPASAVGLAWATAPAIAIPCACITGRGSLLTGTAPGVPTSLAPGTNGQTLVINSACPTGLAWQTIVNNAIPCACVIGKGAIVTGLGPSLPTALPVGTNNQVLVACSTCTTGLTWVSVTNTTIPCACITGKGSLITGSSPSNPAALSPGTDGSVLTACASCPLGLAWTFSTGNSVLCACYTGKGVLLGGTGPSTMTALPVGTNGQLLYADSTATTGLAWVTPSYIPCLTITGKGVLISGSAAGQPIAISPGANGYALTVCSSCPSGLTWSPVTISNAIPCSVITGRGALLVGCALCVPYSLPAGPDRTILSSNSACVSGLEWITSPFICCSIISGKGVMIVGCAAGVPIALPSPTAAVSVLVSDANCAQGMKWSDVCSGLVASTPIGAIQWFAMATPPAGWLVADGSQVSRTGYSSLFSVIGTTYGVGDNSTSFNLPDLRGVWARGWDSAGGTARNCDPNRVFGSTQEGNVQCHNHLVAITVGTAGVPEWCCPYQNSPLGCYPVSSGQTGGGCARNAGFTTTNSNCARNTVDNIALLPCIKWQNTLAQSGTSTGIPLICLNGKGSIVTATAAGCPANLPIGSVNGQVLKVCNTCSSGITWGPPLPLGTDRQILVACNANALKVAWATPSLPITYRGPSFCGQLTGFSYTCAIGGFVESGSKPLPGHTYMVSVNGSYYGDDDITGLMALYLGVLSPACSASFVYIACHNYSNGIGIQSTNATIPFSLVGALTVPLNSTSDSFYFCITNPSSTSSFVCLCFYTALQQLTYNLS